MKSSIFPTVLGTFVLTAPPLVAQNPGENIPERYIVEVKAGSAPRAVAAAHGVAADVIFQNAVNGFAGVVPAGRLRALQQDIRVATVSPDRVVSAYPKGGGAGKPDKPGGNDGPVAREPETIPSGVARIGAPLLDGPTGLGIGIAIVDTGLDFAHPDLRTGEISFKASIRRRRLELSSGPTAGQDDEGHGTHVGGIAAAKKDNYDVVGVAPDATLYAVKVLDSQGRGTDSTVIAGLDWIAGEWDRVDTPIRVVNLSLGRQGAIDDSPAYRRAIQSLVGLGLTVVVAAGNDPKLEVSQQVPAGYPEVIAVASTTALPGTSDMSFRVEADTASYFTTDGMFDLTTGIGVTVSAPGARQENIATGSVSSVGILSTRLGGGTIRHSGTSMASPHVSGVVALLYQVGNLGGGDPTNFETVRARITASAQGSGTVPADSPTTVYTFDGEREGVVDAPNALNLSF